MRQILRSALGVLSPEAEERKAFEEFVTGALANRRQRGD